MAGRVAVFLDRDGTLTEPRHYPSRPEDLVLQPRIGPPMRVLQNRGVLLVLVTNQSGVARGYFTSEQLDRMHDHVRERLAAFGVRLDGVYVCPHHPDGVVEELAVRCGCRKPEAGLLLRAADDLGIDLRRSWMIGDFPSDVEAGARAGCRTVLVGSDAGPLTAADHVTGSTAEALSLVCADLESRPGLPGHVPAGRLPAGRPYSSERRQDDHAG